MRTDWIEMDAVEFPVNGILDLHIFQPKEIKTLVADYIELCREKNIDQIRIIHGKGTGTLRRLVHAILDSHPHVLKYWHEGGSGGSWGATIVWLKPNS